MAVWDELQEGFEAGFDARREVFGQDLCDLYGPTFNEGAGAGDSVSFGAIATSIECLIEELTPAAAQTVVGGETFISSHRVEMKRDANTDAITPRYKIRVHARDGKAERFFEKPVAVEESFKPLVVLKANLVRQGYQQ